MRKTSIIFTFLAVLLTLSILSSCNTNIDFNASITVTNFRIIPRSSPLLITASVGVPQPAYNETVVIIVDSALWANAGIQTAVNNYRTDLNNTGYNTILHTTAIANVQALRTLLQGWYTTDQITGAVLIGPLPYAQYYHPAAGQFAAETFVCDLYLMDLDGSWWDINPVDGIYDKHNATGSADIYPEIYIGRIDATLRTLGGTNIVNIISLLNRHASYRRGGVSRTHSAITYIDDDWSTFGWEAWLNNAYSNRTDVITPTTWTNGTDWLNNRITQDYEFAHLCAHTSAAGKLGWPDARHFFGSGGTGEGQVTGVQIHGVQPTFNFYNLFCCSGADWTTTDCIGMTYLYSSAYSLAVIGTTKTGGMLGGSSFYDSMANNKTIGQALSDWFQGMTSHAGQYLEWFYGMNIMGDPFLTIHYDCTVLPAFISSSTHGDPTAWYTNQLPQFNWTIPVDINGIAGYYYIIDQNPLTIPTASTGTFTTTNGTQPTTPLTEGTWYIHVVAKDGAGNVGTMPTHYQVNIDATGPSINIVNPADGAIVSFFFHLNWSSTDGGSGYHYADIYLDGSLNATILGPIMATSFSGLTDGVHILNVTAYDNIGNSASDQITVTVQTIPFPPIPGFPIEAIAVGAILALGLGLIHRRRTRSK